MKRIALALVLVLAACGSNPAAENQAATDMETLPADESAATPGDQLENGATEAPANLTTGNVETLIPAALHGRWGLSAEDCVPGRDETRGLVAISAESIRLYESVAKPAKVLERTDTSIRGEFAFTRKGLSWTGPLSWSLNGDRLTRIDSELDSKQVYTRCPI